MKTTKTTKTVEKTTRETLEARRQELAREMSSLRAGSQGFKDRMRELEAVEARMCLLDD